MTQGDFERLHIVICYILQTAFDQSQPKKEILVKIHSTDMQNGSLLFTCKTIWQSKERLREAAPNIEMEMENILAGPKSICKKLGGGIKVEVNYNNGRISVTFSLHLRKCDEH